MKKVHDWNEEDQTIAFFCEKFGTKGLLIATEEELAESVIGASKASLIMNRANFKHIMTGEGFEHYSTLQVEVAGKYSNYKRDILMNIVNNIIDKRDLSVNKKEVKIRAKAQKDKKDRDAALIKAGFDPKKMKKVA